MPLRSVSLHSLEQRHPTVYLQLNHILLAQFSIRSRLRLQAALTSLQSATGKLLLPLSKPFNSTQMMLLSIMAKDSRLAILIAMGKPLLLLSKPFVLTLTSLTPMPIKECHSTNSSAIKRPLLPLSRQFDLILTLRLSTMLRGWYSLTSDAMKKH